MSHFEDDGERTPKHNPLTSSSPRGGPWTSPRPSRTTGTEPAAVRSEGRMGAATPPHHAQPPPAAAASPATQTIVMDCDDEYTGEVVMERGVAVPHGRGTLQSRSGRHCYVGGFNHRRRDGPGRIVTERFALWAKWRMNRPDLANTCRVDYPNGDKYCGFLSLDAAPKGQGQAARLSKFSAWVLSVAPVRCRWGELVAASGARYFGEWAADRPHGFGCYVTSGGDRYVGRFRNGRFHDTGALFTRAGAHGRSARLPTGAFLAADEAPPAAAAAATAASSAAAPALCIYDGVWLDGAFRGEGHVTLPGGTRISADWQGASRPSCGELVFPAGRAGEERLWSESFHWEPLLSGASDEAIDRERAATGDLRERLAHAVAADRSGAPAATALLTQFLESSPQLQAAMRVFTRCFYFFYGTCGLSAELGSGQGGNPLGWCTRRNPYGGCIHPGRGPRATATDLRLARLDLYSFARSVLRWTVEVLGPELLQGMDLVGAAVNLTVGRWVADRVLKATGGVLLNVYHHVYAEEGAEVDKALSRLRGRATLDDMGVDYTRRAQEERLFDPYADAVHTVERLGLPEHTLSSQLAVLLQWARDINLSTRLAQAEELVPDSRRTAHPAAASADDLLPIHQYVLSQARLRSLYARARMLADFTEEAMFVDATSQESFCATTLMVCAVMLPRLHYGLRDEKGVLVPASVLDDRLAAATEAIGPAAARACAASPSLETLYGAEALADIATGYVFSWLPDALAQLAVAPRPLPRPAPLMDGDADGARVFSPDVRAAAAALHQLADVPAPAAAALQRFCWQAAGTVLAAVGVDLGVTDAAGGAGFCRCSFDPSGDGEAAVCGWGRGALAVRVPADLVPSALVYARDVLVSQQW